MPRQHASALQAIPRVARSRHDPSSDLDVGLVETAVLWRVLWRRRNWIWLCAAAATVATLLYCWMTPTLFTATAQIIVDPRDRQVVSNDINPSSISPDGGVTQVESQVSVLQSSGVLLRAIASTNLDADPEFNGNDVLGRVFALLEVLSAPSAPEAIENNLKARTLAALRKRLAVKRADKVLVIDLSVTSRDADKAARIANAIADAYLADQAQARADAARQASSALTARLAELQKRVQDAENAVEDYRSENKLVVSTGQLVSDQQLNELTAQLSAAQSRVATLKAQLDQQRRDKPSADGTTEAMQSAVVTKLRDREGALVEKLSNLGNQLGPLHPDYTAVQSELQNVRNLIAREIDRLGRATRVDYERALADERALSNRLDRLKSQSLSDDKTDIQLHELQREADSVRSVYASFLVRAKETGEQASVDSTNARIITRALRPQQRSWPPLALLIAGAAFAGLGLGASASLAHEYIQPLVMSAGQIRAIAEAPVVGVLAAAKAPRPRMPARRGPEANESSPSTIGSQRAAVDPISNRVIQLMLASLMDSEPGAHERYAARCLVVTSAPNDAAERARVAEMIAAVAARNGEHVLFVDADVANEKQTASRGFLDLLRGECTINAVTRPSENGPYSCVDKGRPGSSSRQGSRRENDGWQFTRALRFFDLTVIDAGALTENYLAASIVTEADEILLVAELYATPQSAVLAAAEACALVGAPLTSVMLVDRSLRV